jgi:glutamate synthase domain-containing protein 2
MIETFENDQLTKLPLCYRGGILPGQKVTPEIAAVRGIEVGRDCISPPGHKSFSDARGLVRFANELREISQKPVGIKLCVGNPIEFAEVVAAMVESKTYVDFVTVDGKEGGTGAAPAEYSNHVGTPLTDGLYIVHNLLVGAGVRDRVKVIASGKIISGFGLFRAISLGADIGNSARGMMFALGCIQSLKCHTIMCPTGVANQDKELQKGLVVRDKADRVYNFQRKTVQACMNLVASAGLDHPSKLDSSYVMVRIGHHQAVSYAQHKPPLAFGELLMPTMREHQLRNVWNTAVENLNKTMINKVPVVADGAPQVLDPPPVAPKQVAQL